MSKDWEKYLSDTSLNLVRSVRPAQLKMAECVDDIIHNKGHAFIQAGTGTGKSYGYGVPAVWSGKRVVISTAKKALQIQLVNKDFPKITEIVKNTSIKSLKGKNNYFCKLKYEQAVAGMSLTGFDTATVARFDSWATSTSAGDLANFGEEIPFEYFVRVSDCGGLDCPEAMYCQYLRARFEALGAKVLIVNHSLLAFDLRMGGGKLLGPYDSLIIDEAHQAPRAFEKAFSYEFTERHGDQIEKGLQGQWSLKVPAIRQGYQNLFKVVTRNGVGRVNLDSSMLRAIGDLRKALEEIPGAKVNHSEEGVLDVNPEEVPKVLNKSEHSWATDMVYKHVEGLSVLVDNVDARTEYVAFIEEDDQRRAKLVIAPIEVGPLVAPALMGINSCVYTSATLASGEGFGYHLREFGLASGQVRIQEILPSPFDYKRRSLMWVSKDVPTKSQDNKASVLDVQAKEIHELLTASGGGAFVICPSYSDLNGLYDRIASFQSPDYRIILQKTAAIDPLVSEFKTGWNNVLFGVRAVSEGVDVPGLQLRLVIVTGLCFPHPFNVLNTVRKEVLTKRLIENGSDERKAGMHAFNLLDVQVAGFELAQAAGRLIRTETDFGVLAILDPRMLPGAKGYTGGLRKLIPHPASANKSEVLQVLKVFKGLADKAQNSG